MKVQDFAYQVSLRTMDLLAELHHYNIPEKLRKQILETIQLEIDDIIKKSS